MSAQSFTTKIIVDQSPEEVFKAIQNVRSWWSEEIEGNTAELNDEFDYHYEDVHRCKIKLVEVIKNEKIVWLVEQNYFKFTEDKTEWTGTKPTFKIAEENGKTELTFTHFGLVPEYECYEVCKSGWTNYIQNSLKKLITTGKGEPNATGKPQTETERKLSEK
ncbi:MULTISPECIES: SRPBCC family protein [unclassified Flavobacterium]|uniref:SRPBCC family protein n=1 Tax=unclassified Flavobacterium TaxID=196869 RepID=UPI001066EB91|nr:MULTISPECIES: SRPBCC domain-containing protein [unclassified Flavobacterium]MDQ1166843.1 uncharacterized protein YndB with AHSA1/START domain [Flavobacterium sp. SORGH_AS_0622]TDX12503.1 activator of Hsp90 ATPase-like protein [Flavobacterium sp. S87F.05.LMB.W.Kidney.N]